MLFWFNLLDQLFQHRVQHLSHEEQNSSCLLSQSKYIANILKNTRLSDNRVDNSPLEVNVKYAPSNNVILLDPTLCCTLVNRLVYLMITRPYIAYVFHAVSLFVVSHTRIH